MHRLLKRQVKKYLSDNDQEQLRDFLNAIDAAYNDFDTDIRQIENILEKSSQELFNVNSELQKNLESKNEEVKTTSSKLEAVVNNISEVIYQINREGDWLYLNPAWQKITGFCMDKSLDSNMFEFIHPADVSICRSKLRDLISGKDKVCNAEVRLITIGGSYKWCEIEARLSQENCGNLINVTGLIKDISARKSLEIENKLSVEKFKLIFEKSSVAYLITRDSQFIECNQACLDLFEAKNDKDFLGRRVLDFSPEFQPDGMKSGEKARKMIRIAMETGYHKFDWVHIRCDGSEFPVEISLNYVRFSEGNILFVVLTDLTERKRVENELISAKEKAEEATKAKAQFLSTMSHEIRTPMNAVIGVTHLLSEDNPREDQLSNLNILKLSADNLMALINDVLDFSKIEAGKVELENIDFNFKNFVNSIVAGFEMKAKEKNLNFIVDVDPKIPAYLVGDPTRLSQIITNLCGNAIKFTDYGKIVLKVSYNERIHDKIKLIFEISDTGVGISPDKKNLIFESFSQADSNTTRLYGGTGLGLAITGKLVDLMEGKISVESELGKGTSFTVEIKLKMSTQLKSKVNFTTNYFTDCEKIKGMHILVVEDNPVNVLIIKQFLKKWNVTYDVAKNGQLAYEKVQTIDYDMVLMDLQMPVMDGYTAARNIRNLKEEKYRKLPIIAVTASAFNEIRSRVLGAGMTDFVTKPINPEELFMKLEKYVN